MASHFLLIAASVLSTCNIVHGLRNGAPLLGLQNKLSSAVRLYLYSESVVKYCAVEL